MKKKIYIIADMCGKNLEVIYTLKMKTKMEIIRWTHWGQWLASVIEFKAVSYVFGKKKMLEMVCKCAEQWALEERNPLEHAIVCLSFQTTLCLENRLPETITWESQFIQLRYKNENKAEVGQQFQVPQSKIIKQADENHLSESKGTTTRI